MKKHLTKILCALLLVSVLINIYVIFDNRRQRKEMEMHELQLVQCINAAINESVLRFNNFLSNHNEETLESAAHSLSTLQWLLDSNGGIGINPVMRFDIIGGFLINGGSSNLKIIDAVFADGIADEEEIRSITYLTDALRDILFVQDILYETSLPQREYRKLEAERVARYSFAAFNERLDEFIQFLFHPEHRYHLY